MNIKDYIPNIVDFPKAGVIFKDITPLLSSPEAYAYAIDSLAEKVKDLNITKIVAPESRGFFFAPTLAYKLNLPFVPVRKRNKLPRKTLEIEYTLEYGTDVLCVHEDDITENDNILIFDDVLATGGTAEVICKMAKMQGAKVQACAFIMELSFLNGKDKLKDVDVISLVVE